MRRDGITFLADAKGEQKKFKGRKSFLTTSQNSINIKDYLLSQPFIVWIKTHHLAVHEGQTAIAG